MLKAEVKIFYLNIAYRLKGWKKTVKLLEKVIRKYGFKPGDLNFIITDDKYIKELNKKYLGHNYPTDVISFRYNEGTEIDGDIFISKETVTRNAKNYKVSQEEEIRRVLIHGTLHLCGFNDEKDNEKERMRKMEDYWLTKWD